MSGQLGSLVVEVTANVARFQSDMGKVADIATQKAQQIDKALGVVQNSLKALGVGFAIGLTLDAVQKKIEGVISSAAGLQQLSERTGAAVETLSGLAAVAKLSGTDTDQLAVGLQKLSKTLVDARDGGAKSVEAFRAIGVSTAEIKGLKAEDAFQLIAKRLNEYADGAEKTAVTQQLLGKAGANLLPVLKDLADTGDLQVKVTAEQARLADEYEKNLIRLNAAQNAIFKTIGMELLPVLNAFSKALLDSATSSNGLKGAVGDLAKDGSIRSFAEGAAQALAFVIDEFDLLSRLAQVAGKTIGAVAAGVAAVVRGEFAQAKVIQEEFFAETTAIMNKKRFGQRLDEQLAASRNAATTAAPRQQLNFRPNSAAGAGDTLRAQLQQRLAEIERFIKTEQQLYQQREQYLQGLYQDSQISIKDYFAQRQKASEDFLVVQVEGYNKELAAIQAYIAKVGAASKDGIQAQTQAIQVREKLTQALNAQGAKSTEITREQDKALRDYANTVESLNIRLLQLNGFLGEAARRQAALSNQQQRKTFAINGDTESLRLLDELERQETLRGRINELNERGAIIAQQQATAEGRAQLAFNFGNQGELATLAKVGQARAASVAQLRAIADQYIAIANESGNPKLIADAEAYKLKIDELAASADALGKRFGDIFENGFSTAFADFISGTKSASQAFKSFANSVLSEINSMVAKDLAKALFGGGGSGDGIGGFFSGLFGGQGGGASSGGGLLSSIGSFFSGLGFAEGGDPPVGKASLVGEKGPEYFVPKVAGTVVPMAAMAGGGGGATYNTVSINVPASTSRVSGAQLAADFQRKLAMGSRNT